MSKWGKPTKNRKRIDPRYFLNETTNRGLKEYAQAGNVSATEDEEFPVGSSVRYNDGPPGAEIVGTVQGFSKKYPGYIRVEWERTPEFINARGQERPGHPSGPKATVSDVDPRLLSRVKNTELDPYTGMMRGPSDTPTGYIS
jgi:hypothetical protein